MDALILNSIKEIDEAKKMRKVKTVIFLLCSLLAVSATANQLSCEISSKDTYQCTYIDNTPGPFNCTIKNAAPTSWTILANQGGQYTINADKTSVKVPTNFLNEAYLLPDLKPGEELQITIIVYDTPSDKISVTCQPGSDGKSGF